MSMNVLLSSKDLDAIIDSVNNYKHTISPLELIKLLNEGYCGTAYMPLNYMDGLLAHLTEQYNSEKVTIDHKGWTWVGYDVLLTEDQFKTIINSLKQFSNEYINHLSGYFNHLSKMLPDGNRRNGFRKSFEDRLTKEYYSKENK